MGLPFIRRSKEVAEPTKGLAAKCDEFVRVLSLASDTHALPEHRERAKQDARSLFFEVLVRAEALAGTDLFVDEAKTGGDNG